MKDNVVPFPNTLIHKFVDEKLKKMFPFEPCAYYIASVDVLVVLVVFVDKKTFSLEHKSAESSLYYTRTKPKRPVGFQISGLRHFLKDEVGFEKRWDVGTLVRTIALKAGGMSTLFGNGATEVNTIIRTWKLSVDIKPNPD